MRTIRVVQLVMMLPAKRNGSKDFSSQSKDFFLCVMVSLNITVLAAFDDAAISAAFPMHDREDALLIGPYLLQPHVSWTTRYTLVEQVGRRIIRVVHVRSVTGHAAHLPMVAEVGSIELHDAPVVIATDSARMVRKLSLRILPHSGSSLSSESVASTSMDTFSTSSSAAGGGSGMRRPARFTVSKGACVASMV